jgi:DNA repair exonuclease SbcCD ATPase subunit
MNSPEVDIIEEEQEPEKGKKRKQRRVSISIKDVPKPFYHIKDPMIREQFQAPLPSLIKNTSFDYVIKPPKSGLTAPPPSIASSFAGTPMPTPTATVTAMLKAIAENPELKIKEMEGRLETTRKDLVKAQASLIRAQNDKTAKGKPFTSENKRLSAIKGIETEIERYRNKIMEFETEIKKLEEDEEEVEEVDSSMSGYIPYIPP